MGPICPGSLGPGCPRGVPQANPPCIYKKLVLVSPAGSQPDNLIAFPRLRSITPQRRQNEVLKGAAACPAPAGARRAQEHSQLLGLQPPLGHRPSSLSCGCPYGDPRPCGQDALLPTATPATCPRILQAHAVIHVPQAGSSAGRALVAPATPGPPSWGPHRTEDRRGQLCEALVACRPGPPLAAQGPVQDQVPGRPCPAQSP